jgi:hypothetical protein
MLIAYKRVKDCILNLLSYIAFIVKYSHTLISLVIDHDFKKHELHLLLNYIKAPQTFIKIFGF